MNRAAGSNHLWITLEFPSPPDRWNLLPSLSTLLLPSFEGGPFRLATHTIPPVGAFKRNDRFISTRSAGIEATLSTLW